MNYGEVLEAFKSEIEANPGEAGAQFRWGSLHYFVGYNLWSFEENRPPMSRGPIEFESDEAFFSFLESIPEDMECKTCFETAKIAFQTAAGLYEKTQSWGDLAKTYRNLSLSHGKLGQDAERKEFSQKALEFYQKVQDHNGLASIYSDMAQDAVSTENDYAAAFECLDKAKQSYMAANDPMGVAHCLIQIGEHRDPTLADGKFGDLDLVQSCFVEAKEIFLRLDDPQSAITALSRLCSILRENNEVPRIEPYLVNAVELVVAHLDKSNWSANYQVLAEYYGECENEEKYNYYMRKALEFESHQPKRG